MSAYDHVGADDSYPEVAARAVMGVQQQTPSPIYGYLRAGTQQKIYLFHTLDQGSGWLTTVVHGQSQPYDYAAVFAATDLSQPVPGLESFGHTVVSGDAHVGSVLPFLLGLPLGGLAGYYLRRWQEENPGHALPFVPPGKLPAPVIPPAARRPATTSVPRGSTSRRLPTSAARGSTSRRLPTSAARGSTSRRLPTSVARGSTSSAPTTTPGWPRARRRRTPASRTGWERRTRPRGSPPRPPTPWHDEFGLLPAHSEAERARQTRALIESAKREVAGYDASYPAAAWIWALESVGSLVGVRRAADGRHVVGHAVLLARPGARLHAEPRPDAARRAGAVRRHEPALAEPGELDPERRPGLRALVAQHLGQSAQSRSPRGWAPTPARRSARRSTELRTRAQALARRRAAASSASSTRRRTTSGTRSRSAPRTTRTTGSTPRRTPRRRTRTRRTSTRRTPGSGRRRHREGQWHARAARHRAASSRGDERLEGGVGGRGDPSARLRVRRLRPLRVRALRGRRREALRRLRGAVRAHRPATQDDDVRRSGLLRRLRRSRRLRRAGRGGHARVRRQRALRRLQGARGRIRAPALRQEAS